MMEYAWDLENMPRASKEYMTKLNKWQHCLMNPNDRNITPSRQWLQESHKWNRESTVKLTTVRINKSLFGRGYGISVVGSFQVLFEECLMSIGNSTWHQCWQRNCLNAQCQWRHIQHQQVLSWQILVSKVPSDAHSLVENWKCNRIRGTSKTCFLYTHLQWSSCETMGLTMQSYWNGHSTCSFFQIVSHVQLVDLSSFTTKNTSLHGGTIGHRLVRIDATVGFLAVEEILTRGPAQTGRTQQQQICWKKFQEDLWIMI